MNSTLKIVTLSFILGFILLAGVLYIGMKNAEKISFPIKVVEYSDFQCPACKYYSEGLKTLRDDKYDGKLDFEYRHFPLVSIHEYAYNSALASEAAREQGKFEEYHDILFANQPNLSNEELFSYAQEIGLDMEKFKTDFETNEEIKNRVDENISEANSLGVNATPTFYINGKKYSPRNVETLIYRIDKYINKAESQK